MQKPNYQFEKRRKEMEKKAKKEAKLRAKVEAERSPAVAGAETTTVPAPQP